MFVDLVLLPFCRVVFVFLKLNGSVGSEKDGVYQFSWDNVRIKGFLAIHPSLQAPANHISVTNIYLFQDFYFFLILEAAAALRSIFMLFCAIFLSFKIYSTDFLKFLN